MSTFPAGAATKFFLEKYRRPYLTLDCGDYTYGRPELRVADHDAPRIFRVGRYCSIADECTFFVGGQGRHHLDTLTTYPIAMTIPPEIRETIDFLPASPQPNNLNVIIGNDVWIGTRVILMPGITIHDGAVIAAGSVVTRDVDYYSIVGGVAAKHLRYRYNEEIRLRLIATKWWELDANELLSVLGPHITSSDILAILQKLENR